MLPKKDRACQSKLGLLVRSYRRALGITQEELAWRADMHRTYVADIERGGRNITLRSLISLAAALEVPVECLFASASNPVMSGEILLVEDDPADTALVLRAFKRACVHNPVSAVRDGQEAVDYVFRTGVHAKREPAGWPQLILLDLNLPKLSGLEVLRRIKDDARTRSIPVVVLSASRYDRDIIECSRLGAEHYIIKPFSFESLCRITPRLSLGWALTSPALRNHVSAEAEANDAVP